MTRPAPSLSGRLVAAALIWLLVLLLVGGWVLAWAFRDSVEREFGQRLDAMVRATIAATDITAEGVTVADRPLGDPRFDQIYSGWYWQVSSPDGHVLRSRSLWDQVLPTTNGGADDVALRHAVGPKDEHLLVAERDIHMADDGGIVHVLIAADLAEVSAGVRRFHLLLGTALGLLGLGMAVAVLIQVRFGLRPLRGMMTDLEAVRQGERARLSGRYPQEVAPLAAVMNGVLDKDAELIERARTHVGNLAHGLKTPLAVIQAEMSAQPNRRVVTAQVDSMRRLIEHHLGRASAVAGTGRVVGERVAVAPIAADIAHALNKVFADRNLQLVVEVADDVRFHGHAEDLAEMLGNLMENACKWARGHVRVGAVAGADGITVTVADDGPGLTPEQAEAASRRGKRLDEMTEGWGLGLSIVADLVAVNGGSLDFGRSTLGGLEVRLHLP
ncbi:sensor histidine kinase [Magnetospirillum sulfuroxidans]|uniref:histidine kinase n=1 Tax=Magnetospirillum sulfuroxidans TaxID=611300 RepID=A0ABS5I9G8_9PROT|nr:sensor histidine kinase [Magnetospirillum sulfuroxidans]MBR9970969.1 sensor histidine kinase [Magnetospirillum sulfuroxidans]